MDDYKLILINALKSSVSFYASCEITENSAVNSSPALYIVLSE